MSRKTLLKQDADTVHDITADQLLANFVTTGKADVSQRPRCTNLHGRIRVEQSFNKDWDTFRLDEDLEGVFAFKAKSRDIWLDSG